MHHPSVCRLAKLGQFLWTVFGGRFVPGKLSNRLSYFLLGNFEEDNCFQTVLFSSFYLKALFSTDLFFHLK